MTKKIDKLTVVLADTRAELGRFAADDVAKKIEELLNKQDTINMIFAAAPSQNEFLQHLSKKPIEWNRINAFHMDEYLGLPADAPQGFGNFLRHAIFDQVPFRSKSFLNGNAADQDAECERYASLLEQHSCDIACMGIGENTHIAFNDPHVANFKDPVKVKTVTLDDECRMQQVNDGCFSAFEDVPQQALTLTVPALFSAKHIFCMVPGEKKANAIDLTLHSPISERYPSTILRIHQSAILYIDKQSGVSIA